jgi:hypothetical protein
MASTTARANPAISGPFAYTIEEFEHARKLGKDCLIYEKRAALDGQRDPRLQGFLDRLGNVETGLTPATKPPQNGLGCLIEFNLRGVFFSLEIIIADSCLPRGMILFFRLDFAL